MDEQRGVDGHQGAVGGSHYLGDQIVARPQLVAVTQRPQLPPYQNSAAELVHKPGRGSRSRVTLSTVSVYPLRAHHAFQAAAELGYDGMEVMIWSDPVTQDSDELKRLAQSWEQPITSLHAPCLVISQTVWGRDPAAKLRRTCQMAVDLEVPTVVVHPPFMWQSRYANQFEDQVAELADHYEVTVAVENMYPWRPGSRSHHHFLAYRPGWDPTPHSYDAITLDLSHAATARQKGMYLVQQFGSRLRHLHLADGSGSPLDEHRVPGRGAQDCAKVLQHLAATDWDGDVCLEISTRQARTPNERRADLQTSLEFARAHLRPEPTVFVEPPAPHPWKVQNAW